MFLETLWFYLWGLLWAMYFVTDGFDLGVGMLLPFLGKDETTKRIMYNSTGPLWDGNEVWLIAAGGVTFAAFPNTYAMMFSSFYIALTLLLVALIIRGISFEFRSKIEAPIGKKICDICQSLGSFLIALLVGVAFANLFKGLPIEDGVYKGSFFSLLSPYGIVGGVFFISIFLLHGAVWLTIRTEGQLQEKSKSVASILWIAVLLITVGFLAFTYKATNLFDNYMDKPVLFLVLVIAVASLIKCRYWLGRSNPWNAWFSSAVFILAATFFCLIGMFPAMIPSTLDPASTLTCHNACSTQLTLKIMLGVVLLCVPLVLIYQSWAYFLFSKKVEQENLIY